MPPVGSFLRSPVTFRTSQTKGREPSAPPTSAGGGWLVDCRFDLYKIKAPAPPAAAACGRRWRAVLGAARRTSKVA
jgi:hypothetical protein